MDDVDFPVIVEVEHYNDDHGLWRTFCDQVFGYPGLKGSDIANVPDGFPSMKYNVVRYYMVVFRDDLEGPFLEKEKAEEVANQ
jgi:hypothetical protein